MAKSTFVGALQEFEATVTDMRGAMEFVRIASHLRPRLGKLVNWETIDAEGRALVQSFADQKIFQPETAYRGLYIVLYGAFEQFIRRVLHDAILKVDGSISDYDKLDDRIAKSNIALTGEALATITSPPDHVTLDYERIGVNIGTCRAGANQFTLNADAFALSYANLTPDRIVRVLERLGVDLKWDAVGGNSEIQKAVGRNKTRAAGDATQKRLKDITRKRNRLAHNGNVGIVISDAELTELADFLMVFTKVLCQIIERELPR